MSLDTTPQKIVRKHSHIGSPLFRLLYNVSSLDPISIKSVHLLQVFLICSDILGITAMIPFPWVKFHLLPGPPYRHTLKKGSLILPLPPYPYSVFSLPSPPPQFSESVHRLLHIFRLSLTLLVKETSFPWLGVGIPLSMTTHIFQRIDLEVPIPWFH